MGAYPPPPPGGPGYPGGPGSPGGAGFAQRIDEAIELIELELRHAIGYFNDAVVPQVRRESIAALRTVSDKLSTLADHLDRQSQWTPRSGPGGKDPRS